MRDLLLGAGVGGASAALPGAVIAGLAWAVLVGAGCGAGPLPGPVCAIASPSGGVVITAAADRSPDIPDIQVDVAVQTAGLAQGGQVELFVGSRLFSVGAVGADGTITFRGVTLPGGPVTAKLSCRVAGTTEASELFVSVGPSCGLRFLRPTPSQVVVPDDLQPGPDGRPAFEVVVEAEGVEPQAPVQLHVGEGGHPQTSARAVLVGRQARFLVPLYQGSAVQLTATASGLLCSPSTEIRVAVELGQCATELLRPPRGAGVGLGDGFGGSAPGPSGLRTQVCLTTDCIDGSNAFLKVADGGEQNTTVMNGRACFVVDLPEGAHELRGRVSGPEQSGVAPVATWCVDLAAPVVTLSSPAAGTTLRRADDQDPSTLDSVEVSIEGEISGLASQGCPWTGEGSRVEIGVDAMVLDVLQPGADGRFRGTVRLPQGTSTVQVCAVDELGNRGCAPPRQVGVELGVPSLRIESPATGSSLLRADDLDPETEDALDLDVEVTALGIGLAPGDPVMLEVDEGRWLCPGVLQAREAQLVARIRVGPPDCAGLSDGAHRLVVRGLDAEGGPTRSQVVEIGVDNHLPTLSFDQPGAASALADATTEVVISTDAEDGQPVSLRIAGGDPRVAPARAGGAVFSGVLLLPGPNTLAARVRDRAGNEASTSILVVYDATAPAPTFTTPRDGQVLSAADDGDGDSTNGFELVARVALPSEPDGTLVHLWVDAAEQSVCPTVAGVASCTIQLGEGPHELRAQARDAAGNWASTSVAVAVHEGLPRLRVSFPLDGTHLRGLADLDPVEPGLQVEVGLTSDRPLASCLVTVGELRFPLAPTGASCSGRVTLVEGPQVLLATGEDDAGRVGRSAPVHVTVDTRAPRLSFAEPTGDPSTPVVLNRASPDLDGRPGFQTRVVVEADQIETGQGATLMVLPSGGGQPVRYAAVFDADRRAVFGGVTLADQQHHTLQVTAVDRAGNESSPAAVGVVVDRQAPALRILSPVPGEVVGEADDESSAAGLQKTVAIQVSGAEVGQVVHLRVSAPNSGPVQAEGTTPVPGGGGVLFSQVTLGPASSGRWVLSASVADRHGNVATDVVTVAAEPGSSMGSGSGP